MKYVCLMYTDQVMVQNMPKDEMDKLNAEWRAFPEAFKKGGQVISSHGLEPGTNPTTVRVRDGKTLTTDGPFAETKEQLGGFFIIEAKDLDDAIRFASTIPSARIGSIEVRPLWGS